MIFLILLSLIILLITYFLLKRKRNVDLGNKIPGPRTIPLLGNGHSFLNKSTDGKWLIKIIFICEPGGYLICFY